MSNIPLSDSREVVERSLFHSIRKELVDKGYLPDTSLLLTYTITAITAPSTFKVAGNAISRFIANRTFTITGSTGNNNTYTVVSSSFSAGVTSIVVSIAIPDLTVDGVINILKYFDDATGVALFRTDLKAIADSNKTFAVELFGPSNSQAKYSKKVPRIVIITNQSLPGDLGGAPDRIYVPIGDDPLNPDSYTAEVQPPQTVSLSFDIHLISNSAKQSRVLHGIVALAVPKRGYVPFYNNSDKKIFVNQYSYRSQADTIEGINEDIYMYRAEDIFETENETVREGIAPIGEIDLNLLEGTPDNNLDIETIVIP